MLTFYCSSDNDATLKFHTSQDVYFILSPNLTYDKTMEITISQTRLSQELEQLATYSEVPAPAVTRIVYTSQDMQARGYLDKLFQEAHLSIHKDALGNTFARWAGSEPELPAVATGSHIDAIPNAGMYDGTVGVLGALEAIRALQASGFTPKRSIEIILFTSEEPTRFGVGCLGSRVMAGTLNSEALENLKDKDNKTPQEATREAGFTGNIENVTLPQGYYSAFVELHIEQGPLLERNKNDIGIVTAVAAPATLHITLEGLGGHAGALLMPDRKDALTAAADIVLAVERAAKNSGSLDSVATVGILDIHPRAVNSVPSKVFMTVDARDIDLNRRDKMIQQIKAAVHIAREDRSVIGKIETINADPPATCAAEIIEAIETSAQNLQLNTQRMVSRAYHDTLFMARICPVGMIFIPCKGGVSHRPDEYSKPEEIEKGVKVLAHTLAKLSLV
jgi:N-carbamoyl-L-amino-acid hydrolase